MNGPELQGANRLALVEGTDQGQLLVGPLVNDSAGPRASWEESISTLSPWNDRDGDGKGQQNNEKSPVVHACDRYTIRNDLLRRDSNLIVFKMICTFTINPLAYYCY